MTDSIGGAPKSVVPIDVHAAIVTADIIPNDLS
jgi:hypothetical protein